MTIATPAAAPPDVAAGKEPTPLFSTQEVRFAVVMYGGVSLAVYINGVAQELLHLARATAPLADDENQALAPVHLRSTEVVYRKLAKMLALSEPAAPLKEVGDNPVAPVRPRFVVDILSGSSAGGINGIFLAKALANDQPFDHLGRLWIEKADIDKLLNDQGTWPGFMGAKAELPKSLLNGKYMYQQLLDALTDMEKQPAPPAAPRVAYVDELNLYVTTTDIRGQKVPLALANGVAYERRHRNVFQFVYTTPKASGVDQNDFTADLNPFLAFVARSTSAFPFAFEPMKLADVADLIPAAGLPGGVSFAAGREKWRRFFEEYRPFPVDPGGAGTQARGQPGDVVDDFTQRVYGDGGYLDNKPFSYAIGALLRRRADVPVDRKLIYIEPVPEHPEQEKDSTKDINVVDNVLAALLTLPRYETIREDLQRVHERNYFLQRVATITDGLEDDVHSRYGNRLPPPQSWQKWTEMDLAQMIREKGIAFGAYHRLKVASLVDDLATGLACAGGYDSDSDQFLAVRYLVRAWRDLNYGESRPFPTDAGGREKLQTQNRFLLDFDLSYLVRRLSFVRMKLDELMAGGDRAIRVLKNCFARNNDRMSQPGRDDWARFGEAVRQSRWPFAADDQEEFQRTLRETKRRVSDVFRNLRRVQWRQWGWREDNLLYEALKPADAGEVLADFLKVPADSPGSSEAPKDILTVLMEEPTDAGRLRCACNHLTRAGLLPNADGVAEILKKEIKRASGRASGRCRNILSPERLRGNPSIPALVVRLCLWYYYEYFDDYDMVLFPLLYETGAGETAPVDVVRISPDEAKRPGGLAKLAGTALGNFGAFFEVVWRKNDMLWGRLDAAERLITTLIPDSSGRERLEDRERLKTEAYAAILKDQLLADGWDELATLLVTGLLAHRAGGPYDVIADQIIEKLGGPGPANTRLQQILLSAMQPPALQQYFCDEYRFDPNLNPLTIVRSLGRGTQIVGRMLEGLARDSHLDSKRVAWVARLGQAFWGFVELAVPGSFGNMLGRHLIHLLYLVEVFLIVGGTLLVFQNVQHFGLVALGITVAVHVGLLWLGDYIRGRKWWGRLIGLALLAALILLLIPGVTEAVTRAAAFWTWLRSKEVRDAISAWHLGWRLLLTALLGLVLPACLPRLLLRFTPGEDDDRPRHHPTFTVTEWKALQAQDKQAAWSIVALMGGIFVLGLIGYALICLWIL